MKDLDKPEQLTKSPLIFLLLMGVLVISTLVAVSEYFLRPQIEAELEKESTQRFAIISTFESSKKPISNKLIKK